MDQATITLGYWAIRGLAEPIRTFLEYLQIPYKQDIYTSIEQWQQKKPTMKIKFPNLPYLLDGEKGISESEAILIYAALKANKPDLVGKDADRVEFVQLKSVINDFQSGVNPKMYSAKDNEGLKSAINEFLEGWGTGKKKTEGLNEILGEREYLLGYLTYLDFLLAELVERYEQCDQEIGTNIVSGHANLLAHYKRILALPGVKEYRSSDRFKARPHNNWMATWK